MSNYLWVRRATTEEEEARDAIVDLAVTMGKAKDRTSDIHTPPARCEDDNNNMQITTTSTRSVFFESLSSA